MLRKITLTLLFSIISFLYSEAQCLLTPVSLSERANYAGMIIEGKVIKQEAFIDPVSRNIYTEHLIEVYAWFKGFPGNSQKTVEMITQGGITDNRYDVVYPSVDIHIGDEGLFFIEAEPVAVRNSRQPLNRLYAGPQGFIKYDPVTYSASDVFKLYPDIQNDLFDKLQHYLGTTPVIINRDMTAQRGAFAAEASAPPTIASFAPASVSAGTGIIITINGSGFGMMRENGRVEFANANSGGSNFIAAHPAHYLVWSEVQIQVEVPANAGTGKIRVVNNAGQTGTSLTDLTVRFAQLNVELTSDAYMPDLNNKNTKGGYTLQFHQGLTDAQKNSFNRALISWRCNTFVNFSVGPDVPTDESAGDNVNVIRFDNGAELPSGVLGVTVSRWIGCGGGTIWYLNEVDMTYDDAANFHFGTLPAIPGQFDFESVALHELGHAHQLGHVINNTAVMHYAISSGSNKRTLTASELEGGNYIMTQSTYPNPCGPGPMQAVNAGNCSTSTDLTPDDPEKQVWIYPARTEQYLNVMILPPGIYKLETLDMMGKLMFETEIKTAGNESVIVDVGAFQNGTYLLRLISSDNMYIRKFQVIR